MALIGWRSHFLIALQSDVVASPTRAQILAAMRPLSDLVLADPNAVEYTPTGRTVGKNGAGLNQRVGFPTGAWAWNLLPQTDINILQGYEGQELYIQTETDQGVSTRALTIFQCVGQPLVLGPTTRAAGHFTPDDGKRAVRSVRFEFATLIAVLE